MSKKYVGFPQPPLPRYEITHSKVFLFPQIFLTFSHLWKSNNEVTIRSSIKARGN